LSSSIFQQHFVIIYFQTKLFKWFMGRKKKLGYSFMVLWSIRVRCGFCDQLSWLVIALWHCGLYDVGFVISCHGFNKKKVE
jgi:hypothetical protein